MNMNTNKSTNKHWQDEEALKRFEMISPLLQTDLDKAKRQQMREQIANDNHISLCTLYRYEKAFLKGKFEGLKPTKRIGRIY